jgi:hypothetical protein
LLLCCVVCEVAVYSLQTFSLLVSSFFIKMKIKKEDAHIGIGACLVVTGIVLACVLLAVTAGRQVGQKEIVVPYDEYKMKFYGEKEQGTYTTGQSSLLHPFHSF